MNDDDEKWRWFASGQIFQKYKFKHLFLLFSAIAVSVVCARVAWRMLGDKKTNATSMCTHTCANPLVTDIQPWTNRTYAGWWSILAAYELTACLLKPDFCHSLVSRPLRTQFELIWDELMSNVCIEIIIIFRMKYFDGINIFNSQRENIKPVVGSM